MGVCEVCFQPECSDTTGGMEELGNFARPRPGSHASELMPGQHEPRGYGEWVVHPDEARHVLHQGYALVNGRKSRVKFIQNEAHVTQILVEGTRSW